MTNREALLTCTHVEQMRMQHANWRLRRKLRRWLLYAVCFGGILAIGASWAWAEYDGTSGRTAGPRGGPYGGMSFDHSSQFTPYGGYLRGGPNTGGVNNGGAYGGAVGGTFGGIGIGGAH